MKNKIFVYDDNCPLCSWYSGLFVKYGLLSAEGRKPFSILDNNLLSEIDFNKGRNEIPLIDVSSHQVLYGIDALLEILDEKIPGIKTAGNLGPIKWILKKLYKLISYNRKVIVAKKCGPGIIDCSPDINFSYRLSFLAICLLFNTIMLYPVHNNLFSQLSHYHLSVLQLQVVHFAFVTVNCILAFSFSKAKGYEYLGQVNMLALLTMFSLIFLMIISLIFSSEWLVITWLIATAAFIFKEYVRRMDYAGILLDNKWIISLNLLCLTGFIFYLFH